MNASAKVLVLSLATFLFVSFASLGIAGVVPNTLNYQGTLTDNAGQLITGSRNITISLYTVPTGGTAFWTEQQTNVVLKNGQFSVVLGRLLQIPLIHQI